MEMAGTRFDLASVRDVEFTGDDALGRALVRNLPLVRQTDNGAVEGQWHDITLSVQSSGQRRWSDRGDADGEVVVVDADDVERGVLPPWPTRPWLCFVDLGPTFSVERFSRSLEALRAHWGANDFALHLPVLLETGRPALVDLLSLELLVQEDGSSVPSRSDLARSPLPPRYFAGVERLHQELVERAVQGNDELLELYFGGEDIPMDRLRRSLRVQTQTEDAWPVVPGSLAAGVGGASLFDAVVDYLPSPVESRYPGSAAVTDGLRVLSTTTHAFFGTLARVAVIGPDLSVHTRLRNERSGEAHRVSAALQLSASDDSPTDRLRSGLFYQVAGLDGVQRGDMLRAAQSATAAAVRDDVVAHILRAGTVESRPDAGALGFLHGTSFRVPLFQVESLEPLRVHSEVLQIDPLLHDGSDPLGAISWWLTPNAWLGATPSALLGHGRLDELIHAASQVRNDSW